MARKFSTMQVEGINNKEIIIKNNDAISSDEVEPTVLQKAINNIVKNEKYVTYTINKRILSATGDSFLGVLCEVDIKGKTTKREKETHIFMKIVNTTHPNTVIDVTRAYETESYVYKELSEVFTNLQEEFNIPLEERYEMIKFYDGGVQEVIALENMRLRGFTTYHRTELASLAYMELSIKEIAKFHALSFVLENKRPTYFEKKIKSLKTPINFGTEWNNFMVAMTKICINLVEDKIKLKLIELVKEFSNKFQMHLNDESWVRCLCHGDYKPSNILMKQENGKILKVLPIDYQLVSYCAPVIDIIFLIYSSTDRELRRNYLSYLKDLYHNSLRKFLEQFSLKVEKVFPREEFDRAFEDKVEYGFIISLLIIPLLMSPEDSGPDVFAAPEKVHEANEACKKRLLELVEEFVDLGYL